MTSKFLISHMLPAFRGVIISRSIMTSCSFKVSTVDNSDIDCVVIVSDSVKSAASVDAKIGEQLQKFADINTDVEKDAALVCVDKHPFRVVYAPTGPLNRDFDDVRRVFDAAQKGVQKALKAGSKRPHVAINVADSQFGKVTSLAALYGAVDPLYVPVLTRENLPDKKQKAEQMTFSVANSPISAETIVDIASKLDAARWVYRDVGGTDPERMTPANITQYLKEQFPEGSPVKVSVIEGQDKFEKDYPLFAAVNRCVADVPKHSGRIVFLEYTGEGEIEKSLYLCGKGVVYDTGGHDLKVQGIMAGMHRDKCGAAAVSAFFKFLHDTKPKGIHVVGGLALVRNEIGPNAYVADEIVTSRAGQRVVVVNTDAEGRMAMSDVLCVLKERALARLGKDKNPPQLFTIATLTGHALRAYGSGYSAVMDNGPARKLCTSYKLQAAGEALCDMVEVSKMRREDYDAMRCSNEYGDVLQLPVGAAAGFRGHQAAGVFMVLAAGIEKHGKDAEKPLAYTHIDIAGGTGYWMKVDPPLPAGLNALLGAYVLPRLEAVQPMWKDVGTFH